MRSVVAVRNAVDRSIVCERCVVADRVLSRLRGLLGRRELPPGEGVVIRPAPSIHTFFMRFSIDVVFLAPDGNVLRVASDVKPWRIRSARKAHSVLELSAGEAQRRGVTAGDQLLFGEAAA
jgi:uncharacterized protein